jgi:hypothetical protein
VARAASRAIAKVVEDGDGLAMDGHDPVHRDKAVDPGELGRLVVSGGRERRGVEIGTEVTQIWLVPCRQHPFYAGVIELDRPTKVLERCVFGLPDVDPEEGRSAEPVDAIFPVGGDIDLVLLEEKGFRHEYRAFPRRRTANALRQSSHRVGVSRQGLVQRTGISIGHRWSRAQRAGPAWAATTCPGSPLRARRGDRQGADGTQSRQQRFTSPSTKGHSRTLQRGSSATSGGS